MSNESVHELDKIEEAVEYATGSNGLEQMGLTREEVDKIIDDIKNNRTHESFLYEVVMAVRRKEALRKAQLAGDVTNGVRKR